jgi:hypothetical protein
MRWYEMKQKLDEYEAGPKHYPIIAGLCPAFLIFLVDVATQSPKAMFGAFLVFGIGTSMLAAMNGIKCPYCERRIHGLGRSGDIAILRNMHQCPHCQGKFPD